MFIKYKSFPIFILKKFSRYIFYKKYPTDYCGPQGDLSCLTENTKMMAKSNHTKGFLLKWQ